MLNAYKIAGLGLLTGAAVMLATAGAATAHSRMGGFDGARGPGGAGFGDRGGIFSASFADLDVDGSGSITEEDLAARGEARFAEADADGDGTVTAAELTAKITADMAERAKAAEEAGQTARPMRGAPEDMAARIAARIIERLDTETDGAKDGVLTLAEMTPTAAMAPGRVIDRFDTDDDNAISEAEFDAAKAEIGERMAKRGDRGDRKGGRHEGGRW